MSTLDTTPATLPDLDLDRAKRIAAISLFVLIGVFGVWAGFSVISGAVVASGQAMVHGKPKVVQSLDGGLVAEIFVRDGDIVAENDTLLRLDPTLLEVNLGIAQRRLAAAMALQARLKAEQAGATQITFDYRDHVLPAQDRAANEQGQREIFAARAALLYGQRAQLEEVLQQFDNQSEGVRGQIVALHDQAALLEGDLNNMASLIKKGLARQSQISDLKHRKSQIAGQLAGLEAELARLANARRDAELETLQAERSFKESVVTDLREVTTQIEELTLEVITHKAQLSRIDIPAPVAGIVHEMQVTTRGGVVAPGGTIAEIIPLDEGMDFELRVDPRSIDQVYVGQTAQLIISSLDPQLIPKLAAHVTSVSPDVIEDPRTGQGFYRVGLAVEPEELEKLGEAVVMPGMPVEAYLETGHRSVLSYLLHPITSHLRRALRE
ncbi:HlyD family type I secretion periplasmic adaptor subunit (plasmid) [Pseudorhodobacter turbinis]|uniref:Membrane fusion protein (MFP) family protein n=1 Tax=Pseudorhodobacter turbinis TaxID=2500533 RepID=A0A4P8EMQ2_9RHOB|nr:HlyD family type I secretion periplasmic adaptor subunit [Pseudorhodobacter turbinis]QCO58115.1 HlyD family type I secretion periplasmic adaptor subunit [Pseudorhodobacter turbinis]